MCTPAIAIAINKRRLIGLKKRDRYVCTGAAIHAARYMRMYIRMHVHTYVRTHTYTRIYNSVPRGTRSLRRADVHFPIIYRTYEESKLGTISRYIAVLSIFPRLQIAVLIATLVVS